LIYEGLIRAAHEPGISARVVSVGPSGDPNPAVAYLVRQRNDVVIAPFFNNASLWYLERRYPHTLFLQPDAPAPRPPHAPKNGLVTVFHSEEAAYLAGYLAALVEGRRPGRHVVSAVGGVREPQVDALIDGFRAGARAADPRITVLVDYSHDFVAPPKCALVAREQLARGSGVVFGVAGPCGLGALEAAKRRGAWGVGVDTDQSALGRYILTSVLKREDSALAAAVAAIHAGTFPRSGTLVFDYANGGVGLGKISPDVPAALRKKLGRVERELAAGRIRVH
jgi:basic membrane protein A